MMPELNSHDHEDHKNSTHQSNSSTAVSGSSADGCIAGIPRGVYVPELKMFQMKHNKGKTFTNGGFGIALPKSLYETQQKQHQQEQLYLNLFLWIEEALFLHDSGLADFERKLDVLESSSSSTTSSTTTTNTRNIISHTNADDKSDNNNNPSCSSGSILLNTQDLYQMLLPCGISLPIYRSYAHLRLQTYRVFRYTGNRNNIDIHNTTRSTASTTKTIKTNTTATISTELEPVPTTASSSHSLENTKGTTTNGTLNKNSIKNNNHNMNINHGYINITTKTTTMDWRSYRTASPPPEVNTIAWQVYEPCKSFKKTNPGTPLFHVVVCLYSLPSPSFTQFMTWIMQLQQHQHDTDVNSLARASSLKIATVADSGTVVMFGITDYGVPSIKNYQDDEHDHNENNNHNDDDHHDQNHENDFRKETTLLEPTTT